MRNSSFAFRQNQNYQNFRRITHPINYSSAENKYWQIMIMRKLVSSTFSVLRPFSYLLHLSTSSALLRLGGSKYRKGRTNAYRDFIFTMWHLLKGHFVNIKNLVPRGCTFKIIYSSKCIEKYKSNPLAQAFTYSSNVRPFSLLVTHCINRSDNAETGNGRVKSNDFSVIVSVSLSYKTAYSANRFLKKSSRYPVSLHNPR